MILSIKLYLHKFIHTFVQQSSKDLQAIGKTMDLNRLDYIKNVSADHGWAYEHCTVGTDLQLNFKQGKGVETHALKLPKGSLILLSQRRRGDNERYLTHIVELLNEGKEDKPHWKKEELWGIFRWVKVHWVANFKDLRLIDEELIGVNWGWYDTKAKRLDNPNLVSQGNIGGLKERLEKEFSKNQDTRVLSIKLSIKYE